MKFLLIIPITFVLLLQALHVSIEDVVKIPELIEHFQEHQIQHGDNFITFINKHYGSEKNEHNSKDPEHEELPFHHTQHVCIDLKIDNPVTYFINDALSDKSQHFFVYTEPTTHKIANIIHQPPKDNC